MFSGHQLDSVGRFVADIWLTFIQQSVNIRRGRPVLISMLQTFIFMMIILANVYQGTITSILMDPKKYQKIERIQELMTTNVDFYSDSLFLRILNNYDTNQIIAKKVKPVDAFLKNTKYVKAFQDVMKTDRNKVLIVLCDMVPELLETQISTKIKARDAYYMLNEKLLPYYEGILLTRRSPFYEKLNDLSLKIHESGIKQHWSMMMEKQQRDNDDSTMLGMKEMKSIFLLYLWGILLSIFVFLLEVFRNGLKMYYRRYIKNCMRCCRRYIHRRVTPRMQSV
jgi:hypothetical protein